MVEVNAVSMRFRALGAKKVEQAQRRVRQGQIKTANIAKRNTATVAAWMKANRTALLAIGGAMAGVVAGIIAASPLLQARLGGIRLAFSLIAMEIAQELDPAFALAEKLAFKAAAAFEKLPGPVQAAIGVTLALGAAFLLLAGAIGFIGPAVAAGAATIAGWAASVAGFVASSAAAQVAVGLLLGALGVLALDKLGVLDFIENLGAKMGANLPAGAKKALLGIMNILTFGLLGVLATVGALVVNWVRGDWKKGWEEAKRMLKLTFGASFDFLRDAATQSFRWGKDLIKNFGRGIRSAGGDLKNAAKGAAGRVKRWLSFDITANDRMAMKWGRHLGQLFAGGLERSQGRIDQAAGIVAPIQGRPPAPAGGGGRTINVTLEEGALQVPESVAQNLDENRLAELIAEVVDRRFGGRSGFA